MVQSDNVTQTSTAVNSFDSVKDYLADYRVWLPEFAMYGGIGFLVGFLLKNFGRTIISIVAIVLVTLIVLQYTGTITTPITKLVGLPTIASVQDGVDLVVTWVKLHVAGVIGLLLGLSLGWRVG